jgi:hypothetical protein
VQAIAGVASGEGTFHHTNHIEIKTNGMPIHGLAQSCHFAAIMDAQW